MNEMFMRRCLDLAISGAGNVSPNPLVGAVIVFNKKIIGEGYHKKYGQPHAEANAINSVKNISLLKDSSIYVNLEPCSHFGKTPPCSDLIIKSGIKKVVIGTVDTCSRVAGSGINKLEKSACNVITGVLEKECREINKRFFCFNEKKRPYIILKWAQTRDGYVDIIRTPGSGTGPLRITDNLSDFVVHKWRSEEDSILVGSNTALMDNPVLNVRKLAGRNPVRLVVDRKLLLPNSLRLFDGSIPTKVFTEIEKPGKTNLEYVKTDFSDSINSILKSLFDNEIISVFVEGGPALQKSFIEQGYWDEARVFTGNMKIERGLRAPEIKGRLISKESVGNTSLEIIVPDK